MNRPLTPHERAAIAELIAALDRFTRVVVIPRNFTHVISHLLGWLRNL